ncbi:PIN domain-containing protein [Roseomonas sp. F4]
MTAGYLLDTNLISATAPDRRDVLPPEKAAARAWIIAQQSKLFLPVTAVAEIAAGIGQREASGASRHAQDLAAWLAALLTGYPDRVLPFDTEAALQARHLQHAARLQGVTPGFADLTVACIARARGLVVATRNIRDFVPMGMEVINPFEA